jgi:hypothetical protein
MAEDNASAAQSPYPMACACARKVDGAWCRCARDTHRIMVRRGTEFPICAECLNEKFPLIAAELQRQDAAATVDRSGIAPPS